MPRQDPEFLRKFLFILLLVLKDGQTYPFFLQPSFRLRCQQAQGDSAWRKIPHTARAARLKSPDLLAASERGGATFIGIRAQNGWALRRFNFAKPFPVSNLNLFEVGDPLSQRFLCTLKFTCTEMAYQVLFAASGFPLTMELTLSRTHVT
jgi:hypothetical protein